MQRGDAERPQIEGTYQDDPSMAPESDMSQLDDPPEAADASSASAEADAAPKERAQQPDLVQQFVTGKARGLKSRVRRFTPSWFSVVMGTGICNTLHFNLPWQSTHARFRDIGAAFLALDILIASLFSTITILRYILWPEIGRVLLSNETHSLFLGTIPMGYVTIVSGIGFVGESYGLNGSAEVGAGLWWFCFALSLACVTIVPFAMFTLQRHSHEGLSALWLLPIVPPITVAASGASFANLLYQEQPHYALAIVLTSYAVNGIGMLLAFLVMALYFQRLAIHHLPPREIIVSTMLPLGPCGQGGYALVRLGAVCNDLFPVLAQRYPDRPAYVALAALGPAMYGSGIVLGLLFWGLGVWWMMIAMVSMGKVFANGLGDFSLGLWGSTFPLGSLGLLTLALGEVFDSLFFGVVGTIMTATVIAMWLLCAMPTARGFVRGTLFSAPCLTKLPIPDTPDGSMAPAGKEAKSVG